MDNTFNWLIAGPYMYLAILICVAAIAKKVYSIKQMPRHIRWDLYPVAHDGPQGSPYQKVDYWAEKQKPSVAHELAEMGEEVILLKRTFLYNRKMWNFSFPMHFGMYMFCAWLALIIGGAVIQLATGMNIASTSTVFWAQAINGITVIVGVAGLILGVIGTLGLLYMRYTDEELNDFSPPVTFLNLYLLLAMFAVGLYAWYSVDSSFAIARNYVASLLTLKPIALPAIMTVEVLLLGIFLMYLPFSRMLHPAAKYFFYHNVMWDDEPVTKGSQLEKDITGYLGQEMNWSAPHIVNGSWLKNAGTNPTAEVNKKE